MTQTSAKEQVFTKMQELDAALKTAVSVRTELWSMMANLPEEDLFAGIAIPLTFYENGHVIAWGDDSEHFTPSTFELVRQLWFSPDHTLSKEDVRENVMFNEDASAEALRTLIKEARKELQEADFPHEIETLWGRGYRIRQGSQP